MGRKKVAELLVEVRADMSKLQADMKVLQSKIRKGFRKTTTEVQSSMSRMIGIVRGMFIRALAFLAVRELAQFAKSIIEVASAAVESENLFDVAMGKMADSTRAWTNQLGKSLGINRYEIRKYVGFMYAMLQSQNVADEEAAKLSTTLVKLGYDIASLYDISTEDAFGKLRSGMMGQVRPLMQLGISVHEATIQDTAYKAGLIDKNRQLSLLEKIYARYYAILKQTNAAQGDMARTMESPANQVRRLKSQIEELKVAIGMELLPAYADMLTAMRDIAASDALQNYFIDLARGIGIAEKAIAKFTTTADGLKSKMWFISPLAAFGQATGARSGISPLADFLAYMGQAESNRAAILSDFERPGHNPNARSAYQRRIQNVPGQEAYPGFPNAAEAIEVHYRNTQNAKRRGRAEAAYEKWLIDDIAYRDKNKESIKMANRQKDVATARMVGLPEEWIQKHYGLSDKEVGKGAMQATGVGLTLASALPGIGPGFTANIGVAKPASKDLQVEQIGLLAKIEENTRIGGGSVIQDG